MKITAFEKIKTIILFITYLLVMSVKSIAALFFYPVAYLLKDRVYGNDEIKGYHIPPNAQNNWLLWFFWLFLDDQEPAGYSKWYAKQLLGHQPENKWQRFYVAYRWSAIRNAAYNVNYCYLSTRSDIVYHEKVFGKYPWNRKIRTKNGDSGIQFVWFKTEAEQVRFLFSCAIQKINLTLFFGWNTDYNGRITLALRFRDGK